MGGKDGRKGRKEGKYKTCKEKEYPTGELGSSWVKKE
jgi:hypothetical protein